MRDTWLLSGLFLQVLMLCQQAWGLVKRLGHPLWAAFAVWPIGRHQDDVSVDAGQRIEAFHKGDELPADARGE